MPVNEKLTNRVRELLVNVDKVMKRKCLAELLL
jgi:hypothetical protein